MYRHTAFDCDCPAKFPVELLDRRNNPYYSEILEVAFSQNRVVLGGHISFTQNFLEIYTEGLKHIRDVEFQFDVDVIEKWNQDDSSFSIDWDDLIRFVRTHFNLSNLTLSLNAAHSIPIYQEQQMIEIRIGDFRLDAYMGIVSPLRRMGVDEGLKRFYAFWACYHFYETTAEREVMGESYQALDKVPLSRRDPANPWRDSEKEKKQDQEQDQGQDQEQGQGQDQEQGQGQDQEQDQEQDQVQAQAQEQESNSNEE